MINFLSVLVVLGSIGMVIHAVDGAQQHLQVEEARK